MMSLASLTDAVLTSLESLAMVVGVAFIGLGGVKLVFSMVATRPNYLFRVGIAILITAFLTFLAGLLQRFLELLNFLGELREVMVYGITFFTALLSGTEIGFLLSVFFKPRTLTCVVHGICAPLLLTHVAMLLKANLLGHPKGRLGTRAFLLFLALVRRLLGRFRFALLVGADAFNRLQRSEK